MKKIEFVISLVFLSLVLVSSSSFADQLAWNDLNDSERAAKAISPNSLLVSYCSSCEQDHVEVWLVNKVAVTAAETKGLYEIKVSGKRLFRSVKNYKEGEYTEPARYQAVPSDKQSDLIMESIDLAYVYILSDGKSFQCLGKALKLECDVMVERISLPAEVMTNVMKQVKAKK